jgi:O-antigen/teichoic acid export membrane protein
VTSPSARRELGFGIASNYAALAVQAAFVLVSTPLVIDRAGESAYGAWAVVLAMRGYVSFLDYVFGPTIARFTAAAGTDASRRAAVAAGILVLGCGGALAALLAALAALVLPGLVSGAAGLGPALAIVAVATLIEMPLGAFAHGLFGLGRIWERNAFVIGRFAAMTVALVLALEAGAGVPGFVAAIAVAEALFFVAQALWCLLRVPALRPDWAAVSRESLLGLWRFATPMLGLVLAAALAFFTGPLVAGIALGTAAAALYGVAARIFEALSQALSRFAEVFLPLLTRLDAEGEGERSAAVFRAGTGTTIALALALAATAIGFGEPLIELWVGAGFAAAWVPLALLAGGLAMHAPLQFGVLWSIASDRHAAVARLSLVAGLAVAALSAALVGPMGIDGIALAVPAGLAVFDLWLIPRRICAGLGLGVWAAYLRPWLVAAGLAAPLALLGRLAVAPAVEGSGVALMLAAGTMALLAAALTAVAIGLRPEVRTAPGERSARR